MAKRSRHGPLQCFRRALKHVAAHACSAPSRRRSALVIQCNILTISPFYAISYVPAAAEWLRLAGDCSPSTTEELAKKLAWQVLPSGLISCLLARLTGLLTLLIGCGRFAE